MENNKKKIRRTAKKNSNMILKKHVGLIHCENKLTLIQRKICNILLFNALNKINGQDTYEIPLRLLCSLVGYNSNDTQLIKESIKSLISVVMEWNLLEDDKFLNNDEYSGNAIVWSASSLLAGASIKSGTIYYSYSSQMRAILSSLDVYGRINLFIQAKFNSMYSLVLYENCVRFKNIKQTSWFPINLFRSLMGVSAEKYQLFKEFKRNVITVAVNEINQKADIFIEPQYRKSGRHITAVQFLLSDNENYRPVFKKINHISNQFNVPRQQSMLIEILVSKFDLSEKQAREIVSGYTYEYIKEKINLVIHKKNIEHLGAYLISALRNDYKGKREQSNRLQDQLIIENTCQREAKKASEIQLLKNKYMSYKLKVYIGFIQGQTENIQTIIREDFEQYLAPKCEIFKFYKKKGLTSPFVMTEFIGFIEENFKHLIGEYLAFDDYITADIESVLL